ncbi:MAG: hypothetical protein F6K21_25275 [Symploca sp. SIO2D2]|nr:hypothetical protein [Symploca sp. SIO2D2]
MTRKKKKPYILKVKWNMGLTCFTALGVSLLFSARLVFGLEPPLWLGRGLVLGLLLLLWIGTVKGEIVIFLPGDLILVKSRQKSGKSKKQKRYPIISKLACLLPEEFHADLNTLRCRLIKQKHPKWLIRVRVTACLLNMYRGWIFVKLQNILHSINLRL